ncbi:lipase family protein [Nocardia goodfellowii]|uniref:Alpha/beta hydrolase n=1 Tax=Nocardia goodfellowii TaxID=882446 RepID=A0ABS4Q7B1_9NOCA|nr:lipase family protein [Nocardia goodfellowii]MBP2187483.1 hypothetical protein [Nocardia goodfellowii]
MTSRSHLIDASPIESALWPAGAAGGYRLRYHDHGRISSGSLFLPPADRTPERMPLLTWAHCFLGLEHHNAPSRHGLPGIELKHLSRWLAAGFAVAVADYKGLDGCGLSPFPGTSQIAADIIAICPAAREFDERIEKTVVAAGFCQGGVGVLHAAHPGPELDYKGAVALAPPDFLAYFSLVTGDPELPADAFILALLAGVRISDDRFHPEEFLTRKGAELLDAITTLSVPQMRDLLAPYTVGDLGAEQVTLRNPVIEALARCQTIPRTTAKSFLVCTVDVDPLAPPAAAQRYCAELTHWGAEVTHRSYATGGHMDILNLAAADAIDWAVERAV